MPQVVLSRPKAAHCAPSHLAEPYSPRHPPGRLAAPVFDSPGSGSSRRAAVRLAAPAVISSRSRLSRRAVFVSPHFKSSRRTFIVLQFVSPRPLSSRRTVGHLAACEFNSPHPNSSCCAPIHLTALTLIAVPCPLSSRHSSGRLVALQVVSPHVYSTHRASGQLAAPVFNLLRSNSSRRASFGPLHPHPYSSMNMQVAALHIAAPRRCRLAALAFDVSPRSKFNSTSSGSSCCTVVRLATRYFVSSRPKSSRQAPSRHTAFQVVSPRSGCLAAAAFNSPCPIRLFTPQVVSPHDVSPHVHLISQVLVRLVAPQFGSPHPLSSRRALGRLSEIQLVSPRSNSSSPALAAHSLSATRVKRPFYIWITPSPRTQLLIPRRRCPSLPLQTISPRFRLTADSQKTRPDACATHTNRTRTHALECARSYTTQQDASPRAAVLEVAQAR
ncbi:hypothetical protein BJ912DRAFT_1103261 [Pholiota molesta]|nr:hypothetical protein BJ912DRAFT_1103261 [Pholiota molesta]